MNRIAGCTLAAALALTASIGAQTATSTDAQRMKDASTRDLIVVGCVTKGADGKYMLTNARMDMGADRARTATGTVGTLPTNTAEALEGNMGSAMTWLLQGADLDKHIGHQVQVTGRSASSAGSSMTTTGTATGAPTATTTTGATTTSTTGTTTTGATTGATTTASAPPATTTAGSPTTTAGETTTAGTASA